MLSINLLCTNNYRIKLENISKDTSIDSLKIQLFREYSDKLPIPSNVFIENESEDKTDPSITTSTDTPIGTIKEQDNYYQKSYSSIIHQHQIRLIFSGKQLENFSTLADNSIENGDTILVAISPIISNYTLEYDQMVAEKNRGPESSDTVFLGIPRKSIFDLDKEQEKPIFKLSVNDRSYRQQLRQKKENNNLEVLSPQDTFKLLNRIEDKEKQQHPLNSAKDVLLLPIDDVNNKNYRKEDIQSLETSLDRLSLHDIPTKKTDAPSSEQKPVKLNIQTFTPINEVSYCKFIKIIFNKPFLPVTNNLEKYEIPIKVEPDLPNGKWFTIDGLVFEYKCPNPDVTSLINILPFPLSTAFNVTIDSKKFKSLYNQEIEEKTYSFRTTAQSICHTEYNNSLDNPQIRIVFNQPFKLITSNYEDVFNAEIEELSLYRKSDLQFKVLSNNDPENFFAKIIQVNRENEKTIVMKITSNIKGYYSRKIHLCSYMSYVGSTEGPLFSNKIEKFQFNTLAHFKITPANMEKDELSALSHIRFNTTCKAKFFDIIKAKETNTLSDFITFKPPVNIEEIKIGDKYINIFAKFKPLTTYKVNIYNFQDYLSKQTASSSGTFSFPDHKQKISISNTPTGFFLVSRNIFNLDPSYRPTININTFGVSKLLVSAYTVDSFKLSKVKKVDNITVPVLRKKTKVGHVEYEEECTTKTNIDLSDFFGTTSTANKGRHSILLFKFKPENNTEEKLIVLLQYSPLVVSHFEIGREFSLIVSDINSSKSIDGNDLSVSLYNVFNTRSLKANYKEKNVFEKSAGFQSNHMIIETKCGKSLVYPHQIDQPSNKYEYKWSVINSSGVYRPGNVINVKGLVRLLCYDENKVLIIPSFNYLKSNKLLSSNIKTEKQLYMVDYKISDGKKELFSGSAPMDPTHGSFELNYEIPINCNLGSFTIALNFNNSGHKHHFSVEEFKKKQFLLESSLYTNTISGDSNLIGFGETEDPFSIEVLAKSYTGEILPDTMVEWTIQIEPTLDTFSEYSNYRFNNNNLDKNIEPFKYTGKRNSSGKHRLDMILQSMYSCNVRVQATVIDITNNREVINNNFTIKSDGYKRFGVSKDLKSIINIDEDLALDLIVCDSKGSGVNEGSINITIERASWDNNSNCERILNHTILPENKTLINYNHKFKNQGHYLVTLVYSNGETQSDQLFTFDIYVLGTQTQIEKDYLGTNSLKDANLLKKTHDSKIPINLQCTLNKSKYKLNEQALLLITSKLLNANGFVFFIKGGITVGKYPIQISNGQVEFKFQVQEQYLFDTSIFVYLQGFLSTNTNGVTIPRLSNGYQLIDLKVSYKEIKDLKIELLDLKKFQTPSQESSITVKVCDPTNGLPLTNAQVTMAIVDKAILDLRNHSFENPLASIYLNSNSFVPNSGSTLNNTLFKLAEDIISNKDSEENDIMDQDFEILIRYFSGRTITCKVSPSTTIPMIKEMVKQRDGLPDHNQRLFFLNKQLDQGTVKDNLIKPGSVLNLVIRLYGGGDDAKEIELDQETQAIRLRDNFNPLVLFSTLTTDKNGYAIFNYKLPDSLTLYKVMVFASYDSGLFGTCSDVFTSKLPIQVRPSPPRFLNHNDIATFPVTISNVLDFDLSFEGAFRSENCKILGHQGYKCKLPANSRIVFPCKIKAIVPNSISHFQFVAKTVLDSMNPELCDAVAFEIPIHSASTLESTTINNTLDYNSLFSNFLSFLGAPKKDSEYGIHPLKFDNWTSLDTEIGGLSITINTDPLQKISSSMLELLNYEYLCTEQISSKLVSLYIFIKCPSLLSTSSLQQLKLDKESGLKAIDEMITTLKKRITKNYGFRYWDSHESKEYEYVIMYTFWVLNIISEVSQEAKTLVNNYCKRYIDTQKVFSFKKKQYKKDGKENYLMSKALLCFFYGQIYDTHPSIEFIETLLEKGKKNLKDDKFHQLFIYLSQFLRSNPYYERIHNYINITGTLAHLDFDSNSSFNRFSSSCGIQAILVLSLLEDKKKTHFLNKLVKGLSHYASKDGWFYTTQDNAFNLIACYQFYLDYTKELPPTTTVSIQLNNHYIEREEIILSNPQLDTSVEDNKKKFEIFIPLKQILKNQSSIIIEKKTRGNLFYTLNFTYASLNPVREAINSRGFFIKREFVPVSNKDDVILLPNSINNDNQELKPNIIIKAGSKIKVVLTIKADADSTFVAIKDRLPAGLEPINFTYNQNFWTSQINNRETGVELFSDLLYKGTYHHHYFVIATTPGLFISPPAKIEEMYCPASFGRTKTDIVLIE
ncbi:hypothetical protein DICPUDRAFT_76703 [Dictyostelium purpureum]|uniref:Ubiquitin-like domain-containing protein n=1 Tax=Dictyostelium purpureum TaxID=5786 RepID=F0ZED6_DICPU|nr:uncharacterized protein DICPUDRAFT_76703 [Dictyostelium purpureum]EGC37672.1 hypothetical protein DICPUDRAFT_76703 [Dictyostelium purpureum]|eukprot:XP_003285776.1 hypothetical protein DICPUDRAFT_76703 [Dictyostelium purpureum]